VRLREVSRRTEALGELVEEAEVGVDPLIDGAIDRADFSCGLATSRIHRTTKNGEPRILILLAVALRDQLRPRLLDVVEHEGDELDSLLLLRCAAHWLLHVAGRGLLRCG